MGSRFTKTFSESQNAFFRNLPRRSVFTRPSWSRVGRAGWRVLLAEEGLAVRGPLTLPGGRPALGGEVISRRIPGRWRMKDQRTHLFLLSDPVAQIKVPTEEKAWR